MTDKTTPPDKWRFAEHPEYGRVIVPSPTPRIDGKVLFIIPDSDPWDMTEGSASPTF